MRLLILIGAIISITITQAFAETFEYLPVWNWNGPIAVYRLITKEYNSVPDLSDAFSAQQITNLVRPLGRIRVSPAGAKLACQSFDLKKHLSKIFICDTASGTVTREMLDDSFNESDPAFLNETELVYCSDRTGQPKLWKMDLQTGKTVQLTFKDSLDTNPDVSSTDGKIVFNSIFHETETTAICTIAAAGDGYTYLCDGLMPRFSPDGKRIAFLREVPDYTQIWVSALDGVKPVLATSIEGKIRSLGWRDKDKLFFTSDMFAAGSKQSLIPAGNFNIFMLDLRTAKLFQLTSNASAHTEIAFSSGEDRLYFNSNRGGAWNVWGMDMKNVFGLVAPEELYFLAGDGKVSLSWSPADNDKAEGYNVYFKPSAGKNWWKANDEMVASLSFSVEDLKNGVPYDFKVSACDEHKAAESPYSKIVSTAPFSATPKPQPKVTAAKAKKPAKKIKARKRYMTSAPPVPAKTVDKPQIEEVVPPAAPAAPAGRPAAPAGSQTAPVKGKAAPGGGQSAPAGGDDWGDSKSSSW